MRASLEALRQQISRSAKANLKQIKLLAKGIFAVIVAALIAFASHYGARTDPKMSDVAATAMPSKAAHGAIQSPGGDSTRNSPADGTPAEQSPNNAGLPAVLDTTTPAPVPADVNRNVMATELESPEVIDQEIAAPAASKPFRKSAAGTSNSDGAANPAEHPTTPTPVGARERAIEITAIRRAKLREDRQEWRYCLAPSYAERKVYFSPPIPANAISESAEAAFDRTLKKENIVHDEVQCPRAANRPTLLFRQRYAVRWNQDNGTTVVTTTWRPDIERPDEDLASSQALVMSSTALPIR